MYKAKVYVKLYKIDVDKSFVLQASITDKTHFLKWTKLIIAN